MPLVLFRSRLKFGYLIGNMHAQGRTTQSGDHCQQIRPCDILYCYPDIVCRYIIVDSPRMHFWYIVLDKVCTGYE